MLFREAKGQCFDLGFRDSIVNRLDGTLRGCKIRGETMLMIGERLRTIRESKNLSQCDIEQRTGMLRCYTSRVENGHTVPSIERSRSTHKRSTYSSIKSSTMVKPSQRKSKGLDLDQAKLSLRDQREIESLGRKFTKLKERDKGLCGCWS
jgi:transcriptional regulator with XRE-family HTH domain